MNKNIGTQDAHIRTLSAVILLVIALFLLENATVRILFAVVAAILAGTAFLRSCPLYTFLKKDTREEFQESVSVEIAKEPEQPSENPEQNGQ